MEGCTINHVTPIEAQIGFDMIRGKPNPSTIYRQAIGSLMFLMVSTRPELAFAVVRPSQFMEKSTNAVWVAVKRVFIYLRGSIEYGIIFEGKQNPISLLG